MKKKYILGLAALIAAPIAINKCVEKAFSHLNNVKLREFNYLWRFGNVKYVKLGHGKPLLLLHSLIPGSAGHEWDGCLSALSKHYTVYVPDLIGFGNSSKPEISYSAYLYASLINDFVTDVIGEPCYVAAAGNTGNFAVQSVRFKPDNFLRIMLISPEGIGAKKEKCPYLAKFIETPIYGTLAYNTMCSFPFLWYYLKKHVFYSDAQISFATLKKYHQGAHFGGAANKYPFAALLSGELDWDISQSIKDINKPIHLAWGVENIDNPSGVIFDIRRNGVKFGLTLFENSAALPHGEEPQKFAKCAIEFFTTE